MALVTGGASGIGKAVVHKFIQDGAQVYLLDLPTSPGAAIETEIGSKCTFVSGDVSSSCPKLQLLVLHIICVQRETQQQGPRDKFCYILDLIYQILVHF